MVGYGVYVRFKFWLKKLFDNLIGLSVANLSIKTLKTTKSAINISNLPLINLKSQRKVRALCSSKK
jgi:hypothetical protein